MLFWLSGGGWRGFWCPGGATGAWRSWGGRWPWLWRGSGKGWGKGCCKVYALALGNKNTKGEDALPP